MLSMIPMNRIFGHLKEQYEPNFRSIENVPKSRFKYFEVFVELSKKNYVTFSVIGFLFS